MQLKHLCTAVCLTISSVLATHAYEFQPLGFESIGMGGAGVASARGPMAGYYNPALLARSNHPFELNLGAGLSLREHNLADNIDQLSKCDLSNMLNTISNGLNNVNSPSSFDEKTRRDIVTAQGVLTNMANSQRNNLSVMPNASLGAQMGHFSIGVFATSDAGANAVVSQSNTELIFKQTGQTYTINDGTPGGRTITADVYYKYYPGDPDAGVGESYSYNAVVQTDSAAVVARDTSVNLADYGVSTGPCVYDGSLTPAAYENSSLQAGVNEKKTYLDLKGIALTEVPISYAREFSTPVGVLSIGASAKLMQGITYASKIDIDTDSSDVSDNLSDNSETSTAVGFDLGFLYQPKPLKNVYIGLVGKNLNSPKFKTKSSGTTTEDYTVDPLYRVGLDYNIFHNRLDFAVDYDLSKNSIATGGESQYLGGGVNYHPTSWFSLRGGAMQNMANSDEGTVLTAGLGLGLKWISLDIAAEMSNKKGMYDGNEIPSYTKVSASLVSRW